MSSPTPQDFEKASQIWCQPKHIKKEFDSELATSFAQALADEREKKEASDREWVSLKDKLADQIVELRKDNADAVKEFKRLESEKAELEKRIEVLETEKLSIKQGYENLHREAEKVSAKRDELEKRVRELENQNDLLSGRFGWSAKGDYRSGGSGKVRGEEVRVCDFLAWLS